MVTPGAGTPQQMNATSVGVMCGVGTILASLLVICTLLALIDWTRRRREPPARPPTRPTTQLRPFVSAYVVVMPDQSVVVGTKTEGL